MKISTRFLLGLLALGLQAGLTAAQTPAPANPAAAGPAFTEVLAPSAVPGCALCDMPADTGDACCAGRWVGGVGLYLLQPGFENNLAFGLQQTVGAAPGTRTDTRVDVSHRMEIAPLLWLGYLGENGWGGRARWWYFRVGTSQFAPDDDAGTVIVSAAPLGLGLTSGAGMNVTTKLELQVADLEAMQSFRCGRWDFLFAGGIRLARVNQAYNAYIDQTAQNTLLSGHSFQGVGPTIALESRRSVGASGLVLFGSARGAVVFGSAKQSATLPDQNVHAEDHRNRGLPIGELELGLEYGRTVGVGRVFGQVAFVGQEWFGAGGASRSSVNVTPGGAFVGAGYVGDSDISFLGVSFRLGLNY